MASPSALEINSRGRGGGGSFVLHELGTKEGLVADLTPPVSPTLKRHEGKSIFKRRWNISNSALLSEWNHCSPWGREGQPRG